MTDEKKPAVTLRPREAVMKARTAEIIRTMRDAADAGVAASPDWVKELAELVGVDLRKR